MVNYEERQQLYRYYSQQNKRKDFFSDDFDSIAWWLLEHNSFENLLDGDVADEIIANWQKIFLGEYGGYPLYVKETFQVNNERYAVIAYGVSEDNQGKDAINGILFVRDDLIYIPKDGVPKMELDFDRMMKYLYLVESGEIEPTGIDEYGEVPYICQKCKSSSAYSFGEINLCRKCLEKNDF